MRMVEITFLFWSLPVLCNGCNQACPEGFTYQPDLEVHQGGTCHTNFELCRDPVNELLCGLASFGWLENHCNRVQEMMTYAGSNFTTCCTGERKYKRSVKKSSVDGKPRILVNIVTTPNHYETLLSYGLQTFLKSVPTDALMVTTVRSEKTLPTGFSEENVVYADCRDDYWHLNCKDATAFVSFLQDDRWKEFDYIYMINDDNYVNYTNLQYNLAQEIPTGAKYLGGPLGPLCSCPWPGHPLLSHCWCPLPDGNLAPQAKAICGGPGYFLHRELVEELVRVVGRQDDQNVVLTESTVQNFVAEYDYASGLAVGDMLVGCFLMEWVGVTSINNGVQGLYGERMNKKMLAEAICHADMPAATFHYVRTPEEFQLIQDLFENGCDQIEMTASIEES